MPFPSCSPLPFCFVFVTDELYLYLNPTGRYHSGLSSGLPTRLPFPASIRSLGVISLPSEKLPLLFPLAQAWAVSPLRFSSSEKSLSPSFLKDLSPPYRTRSGWWFFPAIQLCPFIVPPFNVPPFSVGKSAIGRMIDLSNTVLPPPPLAVWSPKRVSLSRSFLFRIPSCPSAPS